MSRTSFGADGATLPVARKSLAEDKFREIEERYRALFDGSLDCVFINDFNGNPRKGDYVPDPSLAREGCRKLALFFDTLHARRVSVDHWIVAASPGFCSGCHWAALLNTITEKIQDYRNAR